MFRRPEDPVPDPWRAGRYLLRSPLAQEGETSEEAMNRWKAEFAALDLDPASVPSDSETAQETFNRFLKERLAPSLRSLSFKGSGANYRLDRGDYRGALGFQKDRHSTRAVVEFTINVSAGYRPTKIGYWSERIGHLMPEFTDLWWRVPHGANADQLLTDVVASIRSYALVALEAVLNDPEIPPDEDRIWPRTFGPDPVNGPLRHRRPHLQTTHPPSLESTFTMLTSGDFYERAQAMGFIYQRAPQDSRFRPGLISILERDPRTHSRGVAARMLAFIPSGDPGVVEEALIAAASEDEDLYVRLNARYALALIRNGGGTY